MKQSTFTHASILILGSAVSGLSFGNGFSINEQSARTLGQAFAGRASDADNASTIASNPAGMALLERSEFSIGAAYIDAKSSISNTNASLAVPGLGTLPVTGSNEGDMIPGITVPYAYYVHRIDPQWSVGLGVYTPYGLKTEYEDSFQGRYLGITSDVKLITAQPTVSYRFGNGLSLGLGITYNDIEGELSRNSFSGAATDIRARVKGDDTGWGYNIGALYEINERTRIGIAYFSTVDYTLEGNTQLTDVPGLGNPRFDASLDLTTPDRLDLGLTHSITPALTLHVDVTRTYWRELDELVVENENAPPQLATDTEVLDWDDTWSASVGLSYRLGPQWTVRGGVGIDPSPLDGSTRSVRVPVGDRKQIAFGATWEPTQDVSIDLGYMYFREDKARIDTTQEHAGIAYSYAATYKNSSSIYALQLNWKI